MVLFGLIIFLVPYILYRDPDTANIGVMLLGSDQVARVFHSVPFQTYSDGRLFYTAYPSQIETACHEKITEEPRKLPIINMKPHTLPNSDQRNNQKSCGLLLTQLYYLQDAFLVSSSYEGIEPISKEKTRGESKCRTQTSRLMDTC